MPFVITQYKASIAITIGQSLGLDQYPTQLCHHLDQFKPACRASL
jgi:hypothetical protein